MSKTITAGGKTYKPEEFVCGWCNTPLVLDTYYTIEGKNVCQSCRNKERCASCGFLITETKYVTVDHLTYHPDCFRCSECFEELQKFHLEDGKLFCTACLGGSTRSVDPENSCGKCNLPLSGSILKALGKRYHEDCFVCHSCFGPFPDDEFVNIEGNPFCDKCVDNRSYLRSTAHIKATGNPAGGAGGAGGADRGVPGASSSSGPGTNAGYGSGAPNSGAGAGYGSGGAGASGSGAGAGGYGADRGLPSGAGGSGAGGYGSGTPGSGSGASGSGHGSGAPGSGSGAGYGSGHGSGAPGSGSGSGGDGYGADRGLPSGSGTGGSGHGSGAPGSGSGAGGYGSGAPGSGSGASGSGAPGSGYGSGAPGSGSGAGGYGSGAPGSGSSYGSGAPGSGSGSSGSGAGSKAPGAGGAGGAGAGGAGGASRGIGGDDEDAYLDASNLPPKGPSKFDQKKKIKYGGGIKEEKRQRDYKSKAALGFCSETEHLKDLESLGYKTISRKKGL